MATDKVQLNLKVQKILDEGGLHFVEGVVYTPNTMDAHGEMMTREDVELIASRYMENVVLKTSIDTRHDNVPNGCFPTQSFIAKANDPDDYPEGSWVLRTQITDEDIWDRVKKGELNGYSWEAYVTKVASVVEIQYYPQLIVETEEAGEPPHKHFALLDISEAGRVLRGWTSTREGHSHEIKSGTATESSLDHSHRLIF